MAREVVWTEPAAEDLEAAAAYIARDSSTYAAAFVREVMEAADSLSLFADRGRKFRNLLTAASGNCWYAPIDWSTTSRQIGS